MRARTAILAATAIALTATSTPAVAAKKPVKLCNLMTDAKGDGNSNTLPFVTSPALDIVGGDIATGKTELVAVLRMASTKTDSDTWRPLVGYGWAFGATGSGTRYSFSVRRGLGPSAGYIPEVTVGDTSPKFTFAVVGNSYVWKLKRADVPALRRPKLFWVDFGANSKAMSSTADNAFSEKSKYPDRALSCVAAK